MSRDLFFIFLSRKPMTLKNSFYIVLITTFVSSINGMQSPSLHQLIKDNDIKKVEELLRAGCNANEMKDGLTPLYIATRFGRTEIVQLLCKYKARVNQMSCVNESARWTPLHTAAAYNSDNFIIDILLNAGADINARGEVGITPLILASVINKTYTLELLCFHDADINQADCDGRTPLHVASAKGHDHVVTILLNAGADIHKQNGSGLTALAIAQENGHLLVAQIIQNHVRKKIIGERMPKKTLSIRHNKKNITCLDYHA